MTPTNDSRRFVVLSGLPGSGKTWLARQLAPALNLRLFDKDDILERLFESKGVGDAAWRRMLSRESDAILQSEAAASDGGVLASFWRVPGMAPDSGTPTDWLSPLSDRIVHVHCACEPEVAAARFVHRSRHPGHLDDASSYDEVLASLRALSRLGLLEIGKRLEVDTSRQPDIDAVVREIHAAFGRHRRPPLATRST